MGRKPHLAEAAGLFSLSPDGAETPPGHLGHRERIRARLLDHGAEAMADYEVLEVLLFANYPRADTKPVAKALIARFGSLAGVLAAPPVELQEVEKVEQFRVLFLDTKNQLLADEVQARGTVNHTAAYPREVVKRALELGATAVILVHNHPSGDPTPSRADIAMTREVKVAADALGITLHDHLIIGNGRHLSFRREGLL